MGRAMLICVILCSTVWSYYVIRVQKKMMAVPDVIIENLIKKESENVSDYALRTAVRDAVSMGVGVNYSFVDVTRRYNNFLIGDCYLDSINYRFTSSSAYRAKTYVHTILQGQVFPYSATIAFDFPSLYSIPTPDGIYYQCDQPQFHGSNEYVADDSGHDNEGLCLGGVSTRPNGYGVDGWKCSSFDGVNDYIQCPDNDYVRVDSTFTVSVWVKIVNGTAYSTVYWQPSDPLDGTTSGGGHPGNNLRYKPSAGIWYTRSDGKLHFASVQRNSVLLEILVPYTPSGNPPFNRDAWNHLAMTFNRGVLKAFINGVRVGMATMSYGNKTITPRYGITLGRREIQTGGTLQSDYMYMYGLMDQIGLFTRALTDEEINNLYWGIIKLANILYIRD